MKQRFANVSYHVFTNRFQTRCFQTISIRCLQRIFNCGTTKHISELRFSKLFPNAMVTNCFHACSSQTVFEHAIYKPFPNILFPNPQFANRFQTFLFPNHFQTLVWEPFPIGIDFQTSVWKWFGSKYVWKRFVNSVLGNCL